MTAPSPPPAALPIEPHLPRLVARLRETGALVLSAEPGAGKTTRFPEALLGALPPEAGRIWVVEPRRLAARMAARFVAAARGEEPGGTVGYRVRFERAESRRTRLLYLTDGVALRALAADPLLQGVGAVLIDEVHERRLETDLLLALLAETRRRRPELLLVAMSATVQAEPLRRLLRAPVERVEGRAFPVEVRHARRVETRAVEERVAEAALGLLRELPEGDVLAFLPGAREIERAAERLRGPAGRLGAEVHRLHGALPPEAQEAAVRPGSRRKVVLSSAVAETSVTVQGVVAVVDSGLARRPRRDPWTGLQRLVTVAAARSTAVQRAGRAGRLRPGVCVRLFTEAELRERPEQEPPAILEAELTDALLALRAAGHDPEALRWLQPPPPASLRAAEALLRRLEAVDEAGRPTALGRRLLRLPLPVRLGRLLLEGQARGVGARAAWLAAWLAETEERGRPEALEPDLLEALRALGPAMEGRRGGAPAAVVRTARRLARTLGVAPEPEASLHEEAEALGAALLAAFPDRLAQRLGAGRAELRLVDGGAARLPSPEALGGAEWMVVARARERARGAPLVTAALALEPETVLEVLERELREEEEVRLGPLPRGAAERRLALKVGQLVLDESRRPAEPGPAVTEALREAVRSAPLRALLPEPERLEALARRVAFARALDPSLPALDEEAVREQAAALCEGATALEQVRAADPLGCLLASWPDGARERLRRLAPEGVALPGRRRPVPVRYEPGRPPWIEAPIQAFFGLREGPRVGEGRVPLVLHLLAPNRRAVQVTDDLAGFWRRLYPQVRRELSRRYPRHRWPEDPLRPGGER